MIVAGTGTRQIVVIPGAMDYAIDTLSRLMRLGLEKFGDKFRIISGMAEGFDEAMAVAAINVGVPFDAYVPGPGYADYYWGRKSLTGKDRSAEFATILSQASNVHYTTAGSSLYMVDARNNNRSIHINFIRNFDMVDAADKMWVYDRNSRGTSHCVGYAQRVGRPCFEIPVFQTPSAQAGPDSKQG